MARMSILQEAVETNITGAVDFGFSSNNAKKLAGMLANFLYSDKEYAVLSELSANAVDAHRMVGKHDLPIKINFPTHIEQELIIRDFGPGLSESDVYKYLTQFGESSKQDDDNQIGFWGLGSKSPAAVTSNWTVISYHDSKKTHYEVFVGETGLLALKKMFESETSESGLEVRIPVENNKTSTWIAAAKKAFKHYPVLPNSNQPLNIAVTTYSDKTDKFGIRSIGLPVVKIITTYREYFVDSVKLSCSPLELSLFRSNIDLFFNFGEIDLSISREHIQYNQKTTQAIKARLAEIVDHYTTKFTDKFKQATNPIDYRRVVQEEWTKSTLYDIIKHCTEGNIYGVTKLPNDFHYYTVQNRDSNNARVVYKNQSATLNSSKRSFNCFRTNAIVLNNIYQSGGTVVSSIGLRVDSLHRMKVVLSDGIKNIVSRIKHWGDSSTFYIIVDENIFGPGIPVINGSEFSKVPRSEKEKLSSIAEDCWALRGNQFRRMSPDELTNGTSSVSIRIKSARSRTDSEEALTDAVNLLIKLGYTVVGHKKIDNYFDTPTAALQKYIEKMKNDSAILKFETESSIKALQTALSKNLTLKTLYYYNSDNKILDPIRSQINSALSLSVKLYAWRFAEPTQVKYYKEALAILGIEDSNLGVYDYDALEKVAFNTYPMLKYIGEHITNYMSVSDERECRDDALNYIKFVDKGN